MQFFLLLFFFQYTDLPGHFLNLPVSQMTLQQPSPFRLDVVYDFKDMVWHGEYFTNFSYNFYLSSNISRIDYIWIRKTPVLERMQCSIVYTNKPFL